MASTGKVPPKKLHVPQIPSLHIKDPELGKALKSIVDYINLNVDPKQGTRVG